MTKFRVLGLLAGPAACAALMAAGPALANDQEGGQGNDQQGDSQGESNVRCQNQTVGAITIDGNIVVPANAFCDLNGTHVTGHATVNGPNGGLLLDAGAKIDGSVRVRKDAEFAEYGGSTVGGNVQCQRCHFADLHQSTVNGSLHSNALTQGAFIENSRVGGSLQIHDSFDGGSGFKITGNTVGGSLVFDRNTGPSSITVNMIAKSLSCNGNTPPPTGGGNTAQHKEGQCALF